jgi:hypothetical protein
MPMYYCDTLISGQWTYSCIAGLCCSVCWWLIVGCPAQFIALSRQESGCCGSALRFRGAVQLSRALDCRGGGSARRGHGSRVSAECSFD